MLQALNGSEVVELNLVEGKIRRKNNPVLWVIPADQPFSGRRLSSLLYFHYCTELFACTVA